MRRITGKEIEEAVRELFIQSNCRLPEDAKRLLKDAAEKETSSPAKEVLADLCENLKRAEERDIPICQDTGMAVLFVEIGREAVLTDDYERSINEGVRRAYTEGYLRCSVVGDPFYRRVNTGDNTPAIIHTRIVEGDRMKIVAAPKGFGSENMSALKMFTPSASEEDLISFVCACVKNAGGNPCPPLLIGVGIGGDFEYAPLLAKKAITRPVSVRNPDRAYAELEEKMLSAVNALKVGPQGFGGITTALAVNVETFPTHIAGLPVAVNICCHVMRHAEILL